MNNTNITSFTDLQTWKIGHEVVLAIYKIVKTFPKAELYGLSNQMRRAAISITSNVAEGFGRKNYKEKTQFYYLSHGSLVELQNQLIISRDVGYIDSNAYQEIYQLTMKTQKLLNGLISKTKELSHTAKEFPKL